MLEGEGLLPCDLPLGRLEPDIPQPWPHWDRETCGPVLGKLDLGMDFESNHIVFLKHFRDFLFLSG